jgi:hypothetical protein
MGSTRPSHHVEVTTLLEGAYITHYKYSYELQNSKMVIMADLVKYSSKYRYGLKPESD